MFDFLEKLRQQPTRTKKKIAFLCSFSTAGIIFVIWLSVLYPNWKVTQNKQLQVEANTEPSPISTFSDMVSTAFVSIQDQVSKLKETAVQLGSGTEYYTASTTVKTSSSVPASSEISSSTEAQNMLQ